MALAQRHCERLPSWVGELLRRNVSVIVAFDGPAAFAAKAATNTIPIVFLTGADPVAIGLVQSFGRPGGNLTGVSILKREAKDLGNFARAGAHCQHDRVACQSW